MIRINPTTDALGSIDQQVDFAEGGNLAVIGGTATVAVTNTLAKKFALAFKTQDWHPAAHGSFATSHGVEPFSTVKMPYGDQVAWPDHCVQGTQGAEFIPDLDLPNAFLVIRKGMNPEIDSYSGFYENDRVTPTGLAGALRERGIRRIFLTGIARNYCVGFTALDGRREGFEVYVIEDAVAAIPDGTNDAMTEQMLAAGVKLIESTDIIGFDEVVFSREAKLAALRLMDPEN